MAVPNLALVVADAWDCAVTLDGYGMEPMTVGWWRDLAYVRMWDYRTDNDRWRRVPALDGRARPPQRTNMFASRFLYDAVK